MFIRTVTALIFHQSKTFNKNLQNYENYIRQNNTQTLKLFWKVQWPRNPIFYRLKLKLILSSSDGFANKYDA